MKKFLFIAFLLLPAAASAHPHVWADASLELDFDKAGNIRAVTQIWRYDEMFSMAAIKAVDKNGDGDLSDGETADLRDLYFSSVMRFGFYTHIFIDGKEAGVGLKLEKFSAGVSDGRLYYIFTVELGKPVNPFRNRVDLGIYDSGYYTDFSYDDDPVLAKGLAGKKCPFYIFEDGKHPVYFGMVNPRTIALCRKKD